MKIEKTVSENRLGHEDSHYDIQTQHPDLHTATADMREAKSGLILRCIQCNELFRPTGYDLEPAFHFHETSGLIIEREMDDLGDFIMEHEGHEIAELHIIGGSLCSRYAYWEPIREDYLQVTDGTDIYTVKRWRNDINEPMRYEIISARIKIGKPILQVQSVELRRQMIADAYMLKLDEGKIDEFIEKFENLVSNTKLEDTVERGFSTEDPMASYVALGDEAMVEFLSQCSSLFTDEEMKRLKVFINANSDYDDVMNIRVTREFQLTPVDIHRHH